jgi:SAM-dependent methyltransferase
MAKKKDSKEKKGRRKKYQPPRLTKFGSVSQFTRTTSSGTRTDGGVSPRDMMTCIAPLSSIEEHRILLADVPCQELFRKAILETVRPGDTVLDLGTGSGVHALFACQAGAKKVYAIESDTVIEVAKAVARDNGFADRIEFVYGNSQQLDLPEKVDVVITNVGFLNTIDSMYDASRRFLKPGGKLLPGSAFLSFVPVSLSDFYGERVDSWSEKRFGLDFSAFRPFAANHPHVTHLKDGNFLSAPVDVEPIDFTKPRKNHLHWTAGFRIERSAILHGLAGWYSFPLTQKHLLSTRPPLTLAPELWFHPYLPLAEPLAVEKGAALSVELDMYLGNAYGPIWRWRLEVDGHTVHQTSFDAIPLSKRLLAKLDPDS